MTWRLDAREVTSRAMGGSASGRRQARQSRALDLRSFVLELEHIPTGIVAKGDVPRGHYSRIEMKRLQDELRARLYRQLEDLVARRLRIPGR